MKKRAMALFTALLAAALGTQASISTYTVGSSGDLSQLYSFGYDGANVVVTNGSIATFAAGGSFTDAQTNDVISWTITGATGWNSATAEASEADFNAYATNLTYGQTVGYDADDVGGVNNNQINSGEVMIFDFDVSGLQSGSYLKLVSVSTGNAAGSFGDWVLVDTNANAVVYSTYHVGNGSGNFGNWIVQNSHYRLYYACTTDITEQFRVTRFTVDVISLPPTNQPPQLAITEKNSRLDLDWSDDPNPILLDHYDVYRSLSSNGTFTVIASNLTESAYTDTAVTNGTPYYYKAKAISTSDVETDFGNLISGTPAVPVPTGLTAAIGDQQVILDWANSTDDMFGSFKVWRSEVMGTNYVVVASNLTASVYTNSGLVNGTTYYFVVSQVDTNGDESAQSEEVSATPGVPVPTGLYVVSAGDSVVELDWDDSLDVEFDSFILYRTATSGTNYMAIATNTPATASAYTDTNVVNNVVYFYAVAQVWTGVGESAKSAEVQAEPTYDLIVSPASRNKDGTTRSDGIDGTQAYATNGTRNTTQNMRLGEGATGEMCRPVVKFAYTQATLGAVGKTSSDIEQVLLRVYLDGNNMTNETAVAQIFSSDTANAGADIANSDFENASYSNLVAMTNFNASTPLGWYEFDVTSIVLSNLANDVQDGTAGSAFRFQFENDLTDTNKFNYADDIYVGVDFVPTVNEPYSQLRPQLRFKFLSDYSYAQWAALYPFIGSGTNDYDGDGLANLGEYAFGGNPEDDQDVGTLPLIRSVEGGGLEYIHVIRHDDPTLVYTVQTTENLLYVPWTNAGLTVVVGTDLTGGTFDVVTNSVDSTAGQRFFRLIVE